MRGAVHCPPPVHVRGYDRFKAVDLLLVENAGISSQWLSLIAEGVESQFATNHPGYRSRV